MIFMQGALTSFSITGNFFEPWFYHNPYADHIYSRHPAIELGNAFTGLPYVPIGPTTISNNQFQSNPLDSLPLPDGRPPPVVGDHAAAPRPIPPPSSINYIVKDRVFIMVTTSNLGQCTISRNTGDGIIYLDGFARYNNNPP
jgi:hypothetical protein